jgi:hypothetical protein
LVPEKVIPKAFGRIRPELHPAPFLQIYRQLILLTSSASLSWDAAAGSIKYKIRYKASGSGVWIIKNSSGASLTVDGLSPITTYTWQVKNICASNPVVSSDWSAKQKFVTPALRMVDELSQQASFQIYPNPASDHATIQLTIAQSSHVYIKVYDMSGREMRNIDGQRYGAGSLLTSDQYGTFFKRSVLREYDY